MFSNSSSSIFESLPTCGTQCLIEGLVTEQEKVIAQDAVEDALNTSEGGGDWREDIENNDNLSSAQKTAVISCANCHFQKECAIRFIDEVE